MGRKSGMEKEKLLWKDWLRVQSGEFLSCLQNEHGSWTIRKSLRASPLQVMPVWTLSISWGQKKKKAQVEERKSRSAAAEGSLARKQVHWDRGGSYSICKPEQDPSSSKGGAACWRQQWGSPGESQSPFLKGQQGIQRVSETMHIPHTKHKLLAANPQLFQVYQKLIRKVVPFLSIGDVLLTWSFWTY